MYSSTALTTPTAAATVAVDSHSPFFVAFLMTLVILILTPILLEGFWRCVSLKEVDLLLLRYVFG